MIIDYIKNLSLVDIITYLSFIMVLVGAPYIYKVYKVKVSNKNKISQKASVKNGISVQAGESVHMEGINESKSKSQ